MNNPGSIINYLDFLQVNDQFDKKEVQKYLNRYPKDKLKHLHSRHFDFSSIVAELLLKMFSFENIPLKEDFEVSYFYNKINVHRSTYASWKKLGFFKNEFGPKMKRRIPVSDINEFLDKSPKYKRLWIKET